jgi:hypothetical protein
MRPRGDVPGPEGTPVFGEGGARLGTHSSVPRFKGNPVHIRVASRRFPDGRLGALTCQKSGMGTTRQHQSPDPRAFHSADPATSHIRTSGSLGHFGASGVSRLVDVGACRECCGSQHSESRRRKFDSVPRRRRFTAISLRSLRRLRRNVVRPGFRERDSPVPKKTALDPSASISRPGIALRLSPCNFSRKRLS